MMRTEVKRTSMLLWQTMSRAKCFLASAFNGRQTSLSFARAVLGVHVGAPTGTSADPCRGSRWGRHTCGIPGYRARIRPIVSRITIHWPSFYNVVTGKTLALPNLIALQHIPLSPAGVIAKRPAPIALPNSCAAEWRMAPDAVFSPYASVRYFTPHMVHSQYNLL